MHVLANIGPGELTPFPQPGIRKIGFEENPSQITVARLLVQSWGLHREAECTNPPCGDFDSYGKDTRHLTREERDQLPQSPEKSTVHTPWRDQVYFMWNHVFFDTGNFMANMYGTATFKPPNTDAFGIEFPAAEDQKGFVVEKEWESETLLAAAYLAPGVSVRLETITPGREDKEPFHASSIDHHESRHNVWYVRKGIKVRFCVEGERQEGLAAVIVFGTMLGAPFEPSSDEEESEEESENDGDKE